jgi:hypothetical protein
VDNEKIEYFEFFMIILYKVVMERKIRLTSTVHGAG